MVDVSAKAETHRIARARGSIRMQAATLALIESGSAEERRRARRRAHRGDPGRQAHRRADPAVPSAAAHARGGRVSRSTAPPTPCTARRRSRRFGRTGVEMEALTAVQVGLLTIYDMCKAADRGMVMGDIRVLEKSGGSRGSGRRRRSVRRGGTRDWVASALGELAPVHHAGRRLALERLRGLRRILHTARRTRRPGVAELAHARREAARLVEIALRRSAFAHAIISRASSSWCGARLNASSCDGDNGAFGGPKAVAAA